MVDIEQLLNITKKEFKEIYGEMSCFWIGKNVLSRNAVIVLANIGTEAAYNLLIANINHKSKLVREYIYWALCMFNEHTNYKVDKEKIKKLLNNCKINEENDLKEEIDFIVKKYL